MSSSNPSGSGYSSPGGSSSSKRRVSGRPNYMTVGSGTTSEAASRLAAMLDQDSGYGGSDMDNSSLSRGWNPSLTEDRFTPASPVPGEQCECRILYIVHRRSNILTTHS